MPVPDYSQIKAKVNRYYPVLVSQHVPATPTITHCYTAGCDGPHEAYYTCQQCARCRWYCQRCLVERHRDHPLHRIEKWNANEGRKLHTSLADLGLVLQLDHPDGLPCTCAASARAVKTLDVLHVDGVHRLCYELCRLETDTEKRRTVSPEQLLANRLFPATDQRPEQAYTFDLLRQYDLLDLYGFINIKQYCDGVLSMGPNGGEVSELHLRMSKHIHFRAGRWHTAKSISSSRSLLEAIQDNA